MLSTSLTLSHSPFSTLAFTVHVPAGKAYLFQFKRVVKRETADFLEKEVSKVVNELTGMGVVVASVTADNAKNIQKGIKCITINFTTLLPKTCALRLASNAGQGFVVQSLWCKIVSHTP